MILGSHVICCNDVEADRAFFAGVLDLPHVARR